MDLDFQDESWRYMLLPLYIAVFQYGEHSFQVLINGQNGRISGQRPVDWRKVMRWLGTLAFPAIAAGLIAFLLTVFATLSPEVADALGLVQLVTVLYLLGIGGYALYIGNKASKMKAGMGEYDS
jgi:hypothetical protein